jgi:TolB-like protein
VAIGPKVFDLLLFLVQNRERVVSKDDLLEAVWSGRIVSESTLTSHINAVRKAIGDSGEEQRLIRTIARRGFRFVGEVQETDGLAASSPKTPKSDEASASALIPPDAPSIAGLPFQNWSGDPEQEYFADGVVEDIITALSRIRWLFVIARNSSFTYKDRAVDVRQVGRELGVCYVMEGSVRKAANRVRITGQLVDATTGRLWADHFEGSLDDIFELQTRLPSVSLARSCRHWSVPRSPCKAQANRKPARLRLLSARHGKPSSGDQRTRRRGAAPVLQGDGARSGFRVSLRAQAPRLDG